MTRGEDKVGEFRYLGCQDPKNFDEGMI